MRIQNLEFFLKLSKSVAKNCPVNFRTVRFNELTPGPSLKKRGERAYKMLFNKDLCRAGEIWLGVWGIIVLTINNKDIFIFKPNLDFFTRLPNGLVKCLSIT